MISRYDILRRTSANELHLVLVFVTAGLLTSQARRYAETVNKQRGEGYLEVYDVADLAPIILAFRKPTTVKASLTVQASRKERFVMPLATGRVAVCAVRAADIVRWPGIKDRTLFDLNVRREIRTNAVRRAIDSAIGRQTDHPNFLAFHNGLTVVCEEIDEAAQDNLVVKNISVVNGAQSTVALFANASKITDNLRIVVKFVEAVPESQLAREVAVRSNTQNPVTNRNLRARDGIQLRITEEFAKGFPGYTFETRPDASTPASGMVIHNDLAAQLLCAIYVEKPWLAVKRVSLFDADNYPTIYRHDTTAAHVVLVDAIARAIDAQKSQYPEPYRRSWQLTRLVAAYIVGQLLRTEASGLDKLLVNPAAAVSDMDKLRSDIRPVVRFSAVTLRQRADQRVRDKVADEFKVDFKREDALRKLADHARDQYTAHVMMKE